MLKNAPHRFSTLQKFWFYLGKQPVDGCWLWPKGKHSGGYGLLYRSVKKGDKYTASTTYVHRFAYENLVGPIPEGMTIDHLCRNRACCNPKHLEVVTNKENILRGLGAAAVHARQTHCVWGHEFTQDNTYVRANGGRQCNICRLQKSRARYKKWTSVLPAPSVGVQHRR